MKNGNYNLSNLDSNMLIAAVKKAKENLKAANNPTAQAPNDDLVNPVVKASVDPLKLKRDQVERRLNEADRAYFSTKNQENKGGGTNGSTPTMSDNQKTEEYYDYEARLKEAKAREAFESNLRHDLYGEPLVDKPNPRDNGARTRGYTDTASDTGAPIRFTGGTEEDRRRKYDDAMSRQAVTMNEFDKYLRDYKYIDPSNLTAEQKDVIDLVKKELTKKSVLGTLTEAEKNEVFDNTLRFLYSHTKSANGDPYPVFIDIVSLTPKVASTPEAPYVPTKPYKMPEIGTVKPDSMSDEEYKVVTDYLSPESQAKMRNEAMKLYSDARREGAVEGGDYTQFLKNDYSDYLNQLNREASDYYVAARREGDVKAGDYQQFSDWASKNFYENAVKPVYVKKDADGNKLGKDILIGELIPPEDETFGAQLARAAMRLVGLEYKAPAGQGYYSEMLIDCSALVKWAVTEVDEYLGVYGVTKKAEYQFATTSEVVWPKVKDEELVITNMQPGDTLFWQGDETGEIKHTAIYIGNGLMIEAQNGSVQIVGVREETYNNDGEGSTLVQVNRMTEDELLKKAKRNEEKHG